LNAVLNDDEDKDVRRAAAESLRCMGLDGISALTNFLNDEDRIVRRAVAAALGTTRFDGTKAVPALIELLRDDDSDVQRAAAWALGSRGPDAIAAVPALRKLFSEKGVAFSAYRAISRIQQAMSSTTETTDSHQGRRTKVLT